MQGDICKGCHRTLEQISNWSKYSDEERNRIIIKNASPNNMKTLYKFHFDGRDGTLYGLFVEDFEKVKKLIASGATVYFGEVLGKHSCVSGPIEDCDVTMVTQDTSVIEVVEKNNLCFGYNPFDYIEDENTN